MTGSWTQRIGWGAGGLLLLVIAFAVMPALVVRSKTSAFQEALRPGMTGDAVRALAARGGLQLERATNGDLAFLVPPPWKIPSNCSTDVLLVVTLIGGRVTRWNAIHERTCTGS